MHILAIQDSVPFGEVTGSGLRNASNLVALRKLGDVTMIPLRRRPVDAPPPWLDVRYLVRESRQDIWSQRFLLRPLSYRMSPAELTEIKALVREIKPDIAVVEGVMLRDVIPILKADNVPVVLDMHNLESAAFSERENHSNLPFWRNLLRPACARREDRQIAQAVAQVWTCSDVDAEKLENLSGIRGLTVPNPVPDEAVFDLPIQAARYENPRLLFVGLMVYLPNRRAVEVLCKQIAPLLPKAAGLTIAGAMSSEDQRQMIADANARFMDTPPEILPLLAESGYSIIPLDIGGGTRIKALEAMAAGVVVIATDKAIEGLQLENGVHFLRANTPQEAIAQLETCLAAPEKAAEIATNAREFVIKTCGRAVIDTAIAAGFEKLHFS